MQNLIFGDLPDFEVSKVEYPKLDYVLRGLEANLEKVLNYERRNSKVVASDHQLLGMLNQAGQMLDADIRFHYLAALDLNDKWCAAHDITTASKAASPYLGEFLNGGDIEFLISSVDRIPNSKFVNGGYADWINLTPVRVVACNYHDSYPWIPGEAPENGNRWAMIAIDLPMLSIMYREWVKFLKKENLEETRSAFIRNYVLANAIKSLQMAKQLVRLTRMKQGLDVDHVRSDSEISVVDYESRLVKAQYSMIKDNSLRDLNWVELLQNTKIDLDQDLGYFLDIIETAETSQNRWALALSQVHLWRFLLLHDKTDGVNQQYRERLQRFLYELKRDRGVNGIRNYQAVNLVRDELERIAQLCKER